MKKRVVVFVIVAVLAFAVFMYLYQKSEIGGASEDKYYEILSNLEIEVLSLDEENKILELSVLRNTDAFLDEEIIGLMIRLTDDSENIWEHNEETFIEFNIKKKVVIDYSSSSLSRIFKISVFPVFRNKETGEIRTEIPIVIEKDVALGTFKPSRGTSGGGGGGGSGGSTGSGGNTLAVCGNGIVEGSEECDETITTNTCDTSGINPLTNGVCTLTFCGDAAIQSVNGQGNSEVCDINYQNCVDSNGYVGLSNCASDCSQFLSCVTDEFCGDDILNGNEECDDGNTNSGDGCDSACLIEPGNNWVCGNGIVEPNEICDGNSEACLVNGYSGTQSCNSDCSGFDSCVTDEFCGDEIINGDEECDGSNLGIYGNGVNQCRNYNPIYEGGDLSCSVSCKFDTSQCLNEVILVPDGLIGFWNFDGNVLDKSNSGNNGNLIGSPIYIAGKGGSALEFNGNGDYVDYADNYDFSGSFSLVAWVKVRESGTGVGGLSLERAATIIGKEMQSNNQYYLEIARNRKVRFYTFGLSQPLVLSDKTCILDTWCHVVATWDGSTKKIYINGQLNVQKTSTGTMTGNSDSFKVGYSRGTSNAHNYFDGGIDEVRVYNRALADSEVLQLYNQF